MSPRIHQKSGEAGLSSLGIVMILGAIGSIVVGMHLLDTSNRQKEGMRALDNAVLRQVNESAIRLVDDYVGGRFLKGDCTENDGFTLKAAAPKGVKDHFKSGKFTFETCNPKTFDADATKALFADDAVQPATAACRALKTDVKILESNCDEGWLVVEATTKIPKGEQNGEAPAEVKQEATAKARVRCRAPELPLPAVEMKQKYNWRPTGAGAAYNQVMATPVVGQLTAGGPKVIVTTTFTSSLYTQTGYVFAFDAKTRAILWRAFGAQPSYSPAIGDIDGDATTNEVVVYLQNSKLRAYKADGSVLWTSSHGTCGDRSNPSLADLEGDGATDVLHCGSVFDGKTGVRKRVASLPNGTAVPATSRRYTIAQDVRPEDGVEIITNSGVFSGVTGRRLCAFPHARTEAMAVARLRKNDPYVTIAGIDYIDGSPYGVTYLRLFRGDTCAPVASGRMPGGGGGPVNIADFDGLPDDALELGTAGKDYYVVFTADAKVLWYKKTHDYSSAVTGSTVFDFNGDGRVEVVYNDEYYLRVYDGKSGKVHFFALNSTGTLWEYPIVADVDDDGHADIVVGANNYVPWGNTTGIRVFSAPANDWVGTRGIWNQHTYSVLNVGDGGEMGGFDKKKLWHPWLKSEHLVGFRNNIPRIPRCFDEAPP